VFTNLLNNAANYTDDGGQISVLVEATDNATVRIRDTGKGIPPGSLGSIFEPFTRLSPGDGQTHKHLGLGLSVVRRIVELHDGTVEARSEGVGRGTEFVVTLPLTKDALRSEVREDEPGSARAARILCVDEGPEAGNTLVRLLEAMGHDVQTAHDAATALSTALTFRPEIVLLDIDAIGIGGHELAGRLLEQQRDPRPMLVALTAWAQESDQHRAHDAGFQRYLLKPVTREAMEGVLAALTPVATRDTRPA
jgi:CheY-like chemotaxis protein